MSVSCWHRRVLAMAAVLAALSVGENAGAATLDVRPTLLQLLPGQKVGVLYLVNQDDAPHTYQIKCFRWLPAGSEQRQEPTDEVISNPTIIEMAPKQTQIVRFGLRSAAPTTPEVAYRMIIDEVPRDAAAPGSGLNVLLRISLPLFVRNVLQPPAPKLAAAWTESDHMLHVRITNQGPYTTRVVKARIVGEGAPTGLDLSQLHYVLPGGSTDFDFKVAGTWAPGRAQVTLTTDGGDVTLPLGKGG
jgi:fimbrial chaperone protein